MGCRCCKMIHSYIFDPRDVQSSGYVNEINNYKPDEQDGSKFKCKQNNDTRPHKEQLQNAELQQAANRHRSNNTKDVDRNHRNTSFREEELGNSIEKCNGIHAYPNLDRDQSREHGNHTSSEHPESSAKRLSQPHACDNHQRPQKEVYPKLPSQTKEHFHYDESKDIRKNISCSPRAVSDMQFSGAHPPESNYGEKLISAGSKSTSNHIHTDQSTNCTAWTNRSIDQPLLDSGDQTSMLGLLNVCYKDKSSSDALYPQVMVNVAQDAKSGGHEGVGGDLEEEDAEVAEALAALEAATAGEDSEEEENY